VSAKTPMARMGRPPLPNGTAHTSVFTLKLSDAERAAIRAAAERAGVSVSQWARAALSAAASTVGTKPMGPA